jgi:hypothetical protein
MTNWNQMKEQARLRQAANAPTKPTKPSRGTVTPNSRSADELRARFEKVILAEGYSVDACHGILDEHFDQKLADILRDVPKFERMLAEYESRQAKCPIDDAGSPPEDSNG